jgi:gliding motility-associated lipoprotein GldD
MKIEAISFLLLCFLIASCSGDPPVPKPRAYPKIDYPDRTPVTYSPSDCPFSFVMSDYAEIERARSFNDEEPEHPCWFNLILPAFDARLHFSYKPLGEHTFDQLLQDDHKLVHSHTVKANYITDIPIRNKSGSTQGFIYRIDGPVASPLQFYASDHEEHFVRASLYFNVPPAPDSLKPVIDFIYEEVEQIVQSIEWKNNE